MSQETRNGAGEPMRFEDLIPAYLSGDLRAEEARELERRMEEDPELEREVRSWGQALADLAASSTPPIEPSAEARRELLARVARSARVRRPATPAPSGEARPEAPSGPGMAPPDAVSVWPRLALAAGIAALVIALGAAWLQIGARERLESIQAQRDQLEERVRALESAELISRQRVDQLAAAVRGMVDPSRQPVLLAALPDQPDASGAAFYRGDGAIFYAFGLPALGPERTYQLWTIGAQGPVSAGTFEVDELGEAAVTIAQVPSPESIQAWAVTVEPAGGVPQPTGPMVIRS